MRLLETVSNDGYELLLTNNLRIKSHTALLKYDIT
jgi:hypothetical protein